MSRDTLQSAASRDEIGGEPKKAATPGRRPPVRLGAVLALALAAAFVVWLVIRDHNGSKKPAAPKSVAATGVSMSELRRRADDAGQPIYWAGPPRRRERLELSETADGRIYVRYLPSRTRIGARTPVLTVGTYRVANAYAATKAVADRAGTTRIRVRGGGIAFFAQDHPTSVYLAYPSSGYQVEVFDPKASIARRLMATGRVRPIRATS